MIISKELTRVLLGLRNVLPKGAVVLTFSHSSFDNLSTKHGTNIDENGAWTIFSAMSCPRHPRSGGKRAVVFGGALSQNVVPRIHLGLLKINKIDAKLIPKSMPIANSSEN